MSTESKPSIVFCHGIWADGSCFSKLIPPLRADGYEVISAQYNLDTAQSDIDSVIRTLARVSSPSILVGHSYGGAVITGAGIDAGR
jgi:pimeloyl-ACP methyl ester carboxylesterase